MCTSQFLQLIVRMENKVMSSGIWFPSLLRHSTPCFRATQPNCFYLQLVWVGIIWYFQAKKVNYFFIIQSSKIIIILLINGVRRTWSSIFLVFISLAHYNWGLPAGGVLILFTVQLIKRCCIGWLMRLSITFSKQHTLLVCQQTEAFSDAGKFSLMIFKNVIFCSYCFLLQKKRSYYLLLPSLKVSTSLWCILRIIPVSLWFQHIPIWYELFVLQTIKSHCTLKLSEFILYPNSIDYLKEWKIIGIVQSWQSDLSGECKESVFGSLRVQCVICCSFGCKMYNSW